MNPNWRNESAMEGQKQKLHFFGCTWDEGITAGQASDALEECAKLFPDAEAAYQKSLPATEDQKDKLYFFGCTWNGDITVGKASDALGECERQFPDREAMWQLQKRKWVKIPGTFPVKEFDQLIKTSSQAVAIQKSETAASPRVSEEFLPTPEQIAELRSFGKEPPKGLTCAEAKIWIEQCRIFFKPHLYQPQVADEVLDRDWRNAPATEKQKEKLRAFGCKFDEGITAGIAKLLIEHHKDLQSAKLQPPDEELTLRTGRECLLRLLVARPQNEGSQEVTIQEAAKPQVANPNKDPIPVCVIQDFTDITDKARKLPKYLSGEELHRVLNEKITALPVRSMTEEITIQEAGKSRITPNEFTIPAREVTLPEVQNCSLQKSPKKTAITPTDKVPQPPKYLDYPPEPGHQDYNSGLDYDYAAANKNWIMEVRKREAINQRLFDKHLAAFKLWNARRGWKDAWEPSFPKAPISEDSSPQEIVIQKAVKLQNTSPSEYTIPARNIQDYAQSHPAIRKPTTYKSTTPIEHFIEWVDGLLARNKTCLGGHWLPAGPLSYDYEVFTIAISRQIAETIESKGYCVEPDARFGSGAYDRNQTLALFKPLDRDSIQPSIAYLGAANLLRLCVLIATADGRVDLVELNAFRQAIENHAGLSLTDHKRLLILEQLLVQELCSETKTVTKIAKAISPEKRLVVGKLLVEVAAANNVITSGERCVLDQIFKAFEIPPDTLEKLIAQICPSQRHDRVQGDVTMNERWLWNYWRTGHPGVVIDDTTLAGKTWNFIDWKALNARWRDLHEWLAARRNQSENPSNLGSLIAGTQLSSEQVPKKVSALEDILSAGRILGASSKQAQKPVAAPAPQAFALDMARVYEITNETKEVVAILSVVMADEPDELIPQPASITLPASEIQKLSSANKAVAQPKRFGGLDAAFHPILDRLLTRNTWPRTDFDLLAREFHFMPLNIHDTLNEWADEVLGDYILDGEDPVLIRRELITKGKN